jgi:hypothetical protein
VLVPVTGVQATGYVNTVTIWCVIGSNQDPGWGDVASGGVLEWANVDSSITAAWGDINDTQTPNWTLIGGGPLAV